jgi:hypothetical protein
MSGFAVSYVAGGRLDPPFYPTKTQPYVKGIRLSTGSSDPVSTHLYTMPIDGELISVAIACSRYADADYWSLLVNGKTIAETIYTKELPEGLFFMVAHPIKAGDVLELQFYNASSTAKSVWVNYQFLVD